MSSVVRVTGAWTGLVTDWLDACGLPAPELRVALTRWKPDDLVPFPPWQDILARAVAQRPDDPAPALQIGAGVQPRHVGVLGYLVLASNTLGEALLAYQRYERLFYGADLAQVTSVGDSLEICWPRNEQPFGELHDTVAIAALVSFLRMQIDNPPPPSRVTFVFAPPGNAATRRAYTDFFACPVDFNDTHTRVRFPLSYLSIPMPHSDPGLRALLDRQAQALLLALPDSDPFDRALQQVMVRLLPDANATLPRAARDMHVSARTLQRRLDARGLTWQQLLDRTREQLARQYLADTALTLGDIALLLGFSEQSAFNRAFRRWTGDTPARMRRGLA